MKNMQKKIMLDILLLSGLIYLMDTSFSGIQIHELLGIGVGILLVYHTLVHRPWIKAAAARIRSSYASWKMNLMAGLGFGLTISCSIAVITGLLIARTLPYQFLYSDSRLLIATHHSTAYLSVLLAGIHIGVHLKALRVFILNKWAFIGKTGSVRVGRLIAVLVIVAGLRAVVVMDYGRVLASPATGNSPLLIPDQDTPLAEAGQSIDSDPASEEAVQNYLDGLICTGCSKHCPLLRPQCQIGVKQAREAAQIYLEEIQNNSSSSSSSQWILTTAGEKIWLFPQAIGLFILGSYYVISWKEKG